MRAIKVYCPPGAEPPLYAFIDALDGKLKAIPRKNADNRHQKEVHQILRLRVQNGSGEIPQRLHPKNDSRP